MAPIPKRKTARAPQVDKLLKPAIGVVLALVGFYFFRGIRTGIPRIDVADELLLRDVFFGEMQQKNYVVLCHPTHLDSIPISSVFRDAYLQGLPAASAAEFFLLDCSHVLPSSGKTIAERFELDLKKRPTIFVSGKVGPPKQIPDKHLKTGSMLVKALKNVLEPFRTIKIETSKDLKTKCLSKSHCALLLKGNSGKVEPYLKDALTSLMAIYQPKGVVFATMDATVLLASGLEEYLPVHRKGQHRFVLFEKMSGGLKDEATTTTEGGGEGEEGGAPKKEGRLITSIAPLESTTLSYAGMNDVLQKVVVSKSLKPRKIPALPNVKTRTKKLEEQEQQKRQRRTEQQQRQQQKSSSSSSQFQTNDGSKEGRKAERERRRAEHYEQNNIKPKTPEEIAEMERKRRQRMEEEAAKWNMEAAEDEMDFEEENLDEQDEDYTTSMEEEEEGDEEDEDVLDLD